MSYNKDLTNWLMALTLCREMRDMLLQWSDAFAHEEPTASARTFKLASKAGRFLERMNQEEPK